MNLDNHQLPITWEDVAAAARRLSGVANRPPVFTSRELNRRVGAELFLKAEQFQRGGAFKFRGAYNALSSLSEPEARGVVASSSGNHAQAVAIAAALVGEGDDLHAAGRAGFQASSDRGLRSTRH